METLTPNERELLAACLLFTMKYAPASSSLLVLPAVSHIACKLGIDPEMSRIMDETDSKDFDIRNYAQS